MFLRNKAGSWGQKAGGSEDEEMMSRGEKTLTNVSVSQFFTSPHPSPLWGCCQETAEHNHHSPRTLPENRRSQFMGIMGIFGSVDNFLIRDNLKPVNTFLTATQRDGETRGLYSIT
ncbi:MAG: hypothetical protein QNJ51_12455 [Calothrix sp. MO_167.B12]|nr:hypothetical protein [Calothrix sp. MO_167.B12]